MGNLPDNIPLPKSNAGSSLLAHLLVSKYQDHQPFYRQIEMFRRSGVQFAASTVNRWNSAAIDLLRPLYECLKKEVLGCDYIQVDESVIPLLDKDKPGAASKGYHWVVRSPETHFLFFHYDKGSKARHVIMELLDGFRGALQSDGYGAYDIYDGKKEVVLLGCWAHARRKFEQARNNGPPRAEHALKMIGRLYEIERFMKDKELDKTQIQQMRAKEAVPILESLKNGYRKTDRKYCHPQG